MRCLVRRLPCPVARIVLVHVVQVVALDFAVVRARRQRRRVDAQVELAAVVDEEQVRRRGDPRLGRLEGHLHLKGDAVRVVGIGVAADIAKVRFHLVTCALPTARVRGATISPGERAPSTSQLRPYADGDLRYAVGLLGPAQVDAAAAVRRHEGDLGGRAGEQARRSIRCTARSVVRPRPTLPDRCPLANLVADVLQRLRRGRQQELVGLGGLDEPAAVRKRVRLRAGPRRVLQQPLDPGRRRAHKPPHGAAQGASGAAAAANAVCIFARRYRYGE